MESKRDEDGRLVRIISGAFKGRRLASLPGMRIRPSSDRLKESVFNILGATVRDAKVLDLFAGTGSLGIEAMSRGAESAVFVDNHADSIRIIARNVKACCLESNITILKRDAARGLGFLRKVGRVFDLVFLDPPYDKGLAEQTLHILGQSDFLSQDVCIVVEHSPKEALPEHSEPFTRTDQRRYGKALVSFYESML